MAITLLCSENQLATLHCSPKRRKTTHMCHILGTTIAQPLADLAELAVLADLAD